MRRTIVVCANVIGFDAELRGCREAFASSARKKNFAPNDGCGASGWNSCGNQSARSSTSRTNPSRSSGKIVLNHSERVGWPFDDDPFRSRSCFVGGQPESSMDKPIAGHGRECLGVDIERGSLTCRTR